MVKQFKIGDLVKVAPSLIGTLDIDPEAIGGMLVIDEYMEPFGPINQYEVKNAEGDLFGLLETSLLPL